MWELKILFDYFPSRPIVNPTPCSWTSVRSGEATYFAVESGGKANDMYVSNGGWSRLVQRYSENESLVQKRLHFWP